MAKRTKEPPKDHIRITLGAVGSVWTADQMKVMLIEGVDHAVAAGLTHFGRANLYLPARDPKGNAVTRIGRHKLEDITIAAPYRSAAEKYGL